MDPMGKQTKQLSTASNVQDSQQNFYSSLHNCDRSTVAHEKLMESIVRSCRRGVTEINNLKLTLLFLDRFIVDSFVQAL